MELHTLGVDGGYTQKDVTELAKVLTGWTIEKPQLGGGFKFNERAHEPGDKYVLGRKIGEHGEKEGEEMLDVLAHHPVDRQIYFAQAGHALCFRQSAASPG